MHAVARAGITQGMVQTLPSSECTHLRSAWHAAVWLTLQQLKTRRSYDHLAFRGQVNPNWPISTSWCRVQPQHRETKLRQRRRFERMTTAVAKSLGFELDATTCRAISQHHGMTSNLLDFTTDPLVAIWFALDIGSQHTNPHRAIWFETVPTLDGLGSRVVLAPPFLRRLHAQRGFFVERRSGVPLPTERLRLVTFEWQKESEVDFSPFWLGRVTPLFPGVHWLEQLADNVSKHDILLNRSDARQSLLKHILNIAQQEMRNALEANQEMSLDSTIPIYDAPWTTDAHAAIVYDAIHRLAVAADLGEVRADVSLLRSIVKRNCALMPLLITSIRNPPAGMTVAKQDYQLAEVVEKLLNEMT